MVVPLEMEIISGKIQKRWVAGKDLQRRGLRRDRRKRIWESVTVQSHSPCWQEV